eukprot:6994976-Lingulodinium_polyedra.AAC.1
MFAILWHVTSTARLHSRICSCLPSSAPGRNRRGATAEGARPGPPPGRGPSVRPAGFACEQ